MAWFSDRVRDVIHHYFSVYSNSVVVPSFCQIITQNHNEDDQKNTLVKQKGFLDDCLLQEIFEFVGPGYFRLIAPVNHQFKNIYQQTHGNKTIYKNLIIAIKSWKMGKQQSSMPSPFLLEIAMKEDKSMLGNKKSTKLCDMAAELDYLPLLQWARDNGFRWGYSTSASAAYGGNWKILQWAINNGCPCHGWHICSRAAKGGHLDVLKWARNNGCPWNAFTCSAAAEAGQLEILQWARENGCPWDSGTCRAAAAGGHLEILQWAHDNGCPWDTLTCSAAAERGHLKMLKWARANGCPWDEFTCRYAALRGHLAVLQWARVNGCPWDENTCRSAAIGGHLEVLQWARANRCPWDENTCHAAALFGHLKILKWAKENGCPLNSMSCSKYLLRHRTDPNVQQWIEKHNIIWKPHSARQSHSGSQVPMVALGIYSLAGLLLFLVIIWMGV